MMQKYFFIVFLFFCNSLSAQIPESVTQSIKSRQHELLKEYVEFLAIPNTKNDPEQLLENANFILKMMKKRGLEGRLLHSDRPGAIPSVYAEALQPGATTTVIFYAHYDGQPVSPRAWAAGLDPFKPQFTTDRLDKGGKFMDFPAENQAIDPNWRIYGRAAADDKAGVYAILNAYDVIKKNNMMPKINIKFFFEGEEEKGSVNLDDILEKNKALLKSDLWIISDGPMHASGRKQLVFGVRGDVNMHLTVYGAKRPLHSGNYGNWAPNPALKLSKLLASMKDDKGKVLIKGFYDDVESLTKKEKAALAAIPDPAPEMQDELAFAQSESPDFSYMENIVTRPTLNINGMSAASIGQLASNIIPTTASAALDLRLVKGNDWQRQADKVIAHIKKQGFYVVNQEPTDEERKKYPNIAFVSTKKGYNAQRTSMDLPLAQRIISALKASSKEPLILTPSLGGSLPLFLFEDILKTPPITVPIVNYDNNQHGENENLKIAYLFSGIETMIAIMMM